MNELQWNNQSDRIARLLARLGPIPDSCGLARIFGSVRGGDYGDLVPAHPEIRVHFDPYLYALWPCVIQTLRHLPRTERVIFICEEHTNYSPLLSLIQENMVTEEIFRTPDLEHRVLFVSVPKGATPRTEPADYLAFEMGQCEIDIKSFKAQAGISILGNRWMIGAKTSREQTRLITNMTTFMAGPKNKQDAKRRKAIQDLIRRSEEKEKP